MVLFPPLNYAVVEDGIYRSATPSELNFPFLHTLNLKSIITLSPEVITGHFLSFVNDLSINNICLDSSSQTRVSGLIVEASVISEETVIEVLKLLSNKDNLPLLITCRTGKKLTGAVVGCLRKLQRWSLVSILEEYRRLAGYSLSRTHQQHEQFIELFDTDLVSTAAKSET